MQHGCLRYFERLPTEPALRLSLRIEASDCDGRPAEAWNFLISAGVRLLTDD